MKEIKILLFSYDPNKRPNMPTDHGQVIYKSRTVTPKLVATCPGNSPCTCNTQPQKPGCQTCRLLSLVTIWEAKPHLL